MAMLRSFLLLLSLCSCQSALSASVAAFGEARYAEAAHNFRLAARETMSEAERARFELYAGLNDLALGNQRRAVEHLTRARQLLESAPELFSAEEQGRLLTAWSSLGRLPGQALVPNPE
jgi:hypothetical protein